MCKVYMITIWQFFSSTFPTLLMEKDPGKWIISPNYSPITWPLNVRILAWNWIIEIVAQNVKFWDTQYLLHYIFLTNCNVFNVWSQHYLVVNVSLILHLSYFFAQVILKNTSRSVFCHFRKGLASCIHSFTFLGFIMNNSSTVL